MKKFLFSLVLGALLPLSLQSLARDVAGAKNLICAPVTAIECSNDGSCNTGTPESIDFPQFIRINLDNRLALGEARDGKKRISKIMNIVDSKATVILQGAQLGRGWSAVINKATGKFVVTASAADYAFVVFGSCTAISP
jgi:hypothetical protein